MKWSKKLIALFAVVVLLLACWGYDALRVREFSVELVEATPSPAVADGQTPVTVTLRVTRGGEPCGGHVLLAKSMNGGSFKAKRVTTDGDGVARFTYYPYLKSRLNELTDVTLTFADESNSVLIAVPARLTCVLEMVEGNGGSGGQKTNDEMFG